MYIEITGIIILYRKDTCIFSLNEGIQTYMYKIYTYSSCSFKTKSKKKKPDKKNPKKRQSFKSNQTIFFLPTHDLRLAYLPIIPLTTAVQRRSGQKCKLTGLYLHKFVSFFFISKTKNFGPFHNVIFCHPHFTHNPLCIHKSRLIYFD